VIFGGDYTYVASDDMVSSMDFTFIDNLEDNAWTELNLSWRQQVIKNIDDAQKTSIKSIQLQRILPGTNRDECAIYRVRCEKDKSKKPTWYFLNFDQLKDLLSGEEWMSGRMNTLPFIGSNIQITLSLGSRKKDSCAIQVNDRVSVLNHGNYWIHTAKVKQIDEESGDVKVKWDSTGTFSVVCLDDIERIEINENSSRIRNYPDYFSDTCYCQ